MIHYALNKGNLMICYLSEQNLMMCYMMKCYGTLCWTLVLFVSKILFFVQGQTKS